MKEYFESKITKLFGHFVTFYINKHLHISKSTFVPTAAKSGKKLLLYIHVPFCITFCPYCSFHKFSFSKERSDEYFRYLRLEVSHLKSLGFDFDRLVIGGGSPLLCEDEMIKTIEFVKNLFSVRYVSCESDPLHILPRTVVRLKGVVDRLSIGIQTFDDKTLKILGRYDKFGSGQEIFEKIAKIITILPIISIDIIFNFPNQTQKALMYDLEMLKKLYPEQTSVYPLMSSDIMRDNIKSKLGNFSVENERRYFDIVKESLREAYPVKYGWSFMKKHSDLIDEYVIDKSEYIGAGAGAFSFLDGSLYVNEFSLENYMRSIAKRGISTAYKKSFSQKSISYYEILTKLYSGAVAKDAFKGLFWQFTALKLIGAVREEESAISVTDFGDYLFMNAMKEFYIGMDKIRLMGKSAL